jgi:hypothetical protein
MSRTHGTRRRLWAVAVAGLALAACGGDDDASGGGLFDPAGADADADDDNDDLEEFGEAMNRAQGAGGGGSLTFDGTEHPIDSAICSNNGGRIDIGTVGPDGYRVFVTGDPADLGLQVLTPEGVQWFDGDPFQDNKPTVSIDGNTVTVTGGKFFNNQDDELITIEFTIDCPNPVL